jgi:hypothetical protein
MTVDSFAGVNFSAHFGDMLAPGEVAADGGFQVIWDQAPPTNDKQIVKSIVLGGVQSKIAVKAKTTGAAPAVDTVALGFPGVFSLLATVFLPDSAGGAPLDTGPQDHDRGAIGLFDGSRQRCYAWTDQDAANPASCFAYISDTEALVKADHNSGSSGGLEASGAASYDGSDLKMTWSPNDAVAALWASVTIGNPASGSQERSETDALGMADSVASASAFSRTISPN